MDVYVFPFKDIFNYEINCLRYGREHLFFKKFDESIKNVKSLGDAIRDIYSKLDYKVFSKDNISLSDYSQKDIRNPTREEILLAKKHQEKANTLWEKISEVAQNFLDS